MFPTHLRLSYAWSNGAQTKTASNLAAGTYTVTVTSSNGCSTVLMATLTAPQPLVLTVGSKTNVTCFGGQNGAATVGATGGTAPYLYLWSSGSTASSISNLAAGTYTCTTTDAHGCTATTTAQITTPLAITVAVSNHTDVACNDGQNGAITVNATGGSIPFNYTWSNNNAGATISNLGTGTYTCTVSDANGCTKTTSTSIVATDHTGPQLVLQNASAVLDGNGTATVTPAMFDNGSFKPNLQHQ